MLRPLKYLLLIGGFTITTFAFAQKTSEIVKRADVLFKAGNYEEALSDYLILFKEEPQSEVYSYRIGICYLNTNINKAKAAPYLENVTKREQYDNNALYLLGRAYHYAYRFDDAIRAYNRFKDVGKGTAENMKDVEKQLQYCFNSKELIKFPVDVSFKNLGPNVNSPYPDYFPFVSSDETYLIFNSTRAEGDARQKENGSYSPSAFKSQIKNGNFGKSQNISHFIDMPDGDEEIVGFSPDGKIMLMYHDDFKGSYNLYMLKADTDFSFGAPEKLNETVNTNKHEIAACINNEGDVLYFASNRPGGKGGTDIYMSKRLPTGAWGLPVNLDEPVNGPANEDFPNLSADGKTLYFSSDGHTSMGGYDIFKAAWDEKNNRWVGMKNLGYPINTPIDNLNFRISAKGRYGYLSALRAGGQGDLDIYRVAFNDIDHNYVVISGFITARDKTAVRPFSNKAVSIRVINNANKEVFGTYQLNPITGKYVAIVPPGNYSISVEYTGYVRQLDIVNIPEKIFTETEINRDFNLFADSTWKPSVLTVDTTALQNDSTAVPVIRADTTQTTK